MIDLHLHTTASDGRSSPEELAREAHAVGITIMAVTDHDTTAAIRRTQAAAADAGMVCIAGIEVTAVYRSKDVHILGYFIDPEATALLDFLSVQQQQRRRRLLEMLERLEGLGVAIDAGPLVAATAQDGRSVGRPLVAAALVAAGHAADIGDAFERFLADGRPAFVARRGSPPEEVVARIHEAGGLVSLAHPGKMGLDAMIPGLIDHGLDGIEAFHPDHTADDQARYIALADAHGLCVTGGSDYHGHGSGRVEGFGRVALPRERYDDLVARRGRL
ncbi:MAG: PHP domain-containing protein [Acidobacteria bacterium]|nr:PHP domain-containing protein [Acidobacteriota bacterium]